MTKPTSTDRVRGDCRLITQTLNKLSTPRILLRLVVIVAAAIIWLWVSSLLLRFGRGLTYSSFTSLGQQVIDMLMLINPYLWWVIVALWTLIVFFSVRAWFNSSVETGRAASIEPDEFRALCTRLSPEVREVMHWSWLNHDEPFTVGDLRRALFETRHGRIDKIAIVREQEAILHLSEAESATVARAPHLATSAPSIKPPVGAAHSPQRTDPAEPVVAASRNEPQVRISGETRSGDTPRRPVEPTIGDKNL